MSNPSTAIVHEISRSSGVESALRYGTEKSVQNIAGALAACTEDFVIETIAFGTVARGQAEVTRDLEVFFELFPDYRFQCEGCAEAADGSVVVWGRARMTWTGRLPGGRWLRLPRRTIDLPATAIYDVRDGKLARERFLFDMRAFCRQLGLPAALVAWLLRRVERERIRAIRGQR